MTVETNGVISTGMNEHSVLAECERGEDAAKHAYEAALKQDLPTDVRTIIERQYQGVGNTKE
jgi:uncharacterized protein (TIGR02284 family)